MGRAVMTIRHYRIRLEFRRQLNGHTETFGSRQADAHEAAKSWLKRAGQAGDMVALETLDDRFPANVLETIYYHYKDVAK